MTDHLHEYDVLVLGGGSAGLGAAEAAASRGRKVGIVEPRLGVALARRPPGVTVIVGYGTFTGPHSVAISHEWGGHQQVATADRIVIATGSVPGAIGTSTSASTSCPSKVPSNAIVVGAGPDGLEHCATLVRQGVDVTVIERRQVLLEGCDRELVERFRVMLAGRGVRLRLGQAVAGIEHIEDHSVAVLDTGVRLVSERVVFTGGREAGTVRLGLEMAGLAAGRRGRLRVDPLHRTKVGHIYAAGSVLGRPLGARPSAEQGRAAGFAAAGSCIPPSTTGHGFLWSDPELAFGGASEEDLLGDRVPYEVGTAPLLAGGLLKVLVEVDTETVAGVHAVGPGAVDLVAAAAPCVSSDDDLQRLLAETAKRPELAAIWIAARGVSERLRRLDRRLVA